MIEPKPKSEGSPALCHCALLVAGSKGEILFADDRAQAWLKRFFPGPKHWKRLPQRVSRWLEEEPNLARFPSLMAKRKGAWLFVRAFRPHPPDSIPLLLELQDGGGRVIELRHRDFTPRESEVHFWVAEGKTNAEIGCILRIATSTAAKHIKRLTRKLGVENRNAAARFFESPDGQRAA